jgi:hypothetical protein
LIALTVVAPFYSASWPLSARCSLRGFARANNLTLARRLEVMQLAESLF